MEEIARFIVILWWKHLFILLICEVSFYSCKNIDYFSETLGWLLETMIPGWIYRKNGYLMSECLHSTSHNSID